MNFRLVIIFLMFFSCNRPLNGEEIQLQFLEQKNFVKDNTIKHELDSILPGINCLAKTACLKYFVLPMHYQAKDTNQILLIPFRKKNGIGVSSGFSDILSRCVFICPSQIREFVRANSLSDTADIGGYLSLILLHELGHYIYKIPGNFDENVTVESKKSGTGEQDLGLSPEVMTFNKKKELQVDSLAIEMVKKGSSTTKADCFDISFKTELAINGAEFMLFGKRLLDQFGSTNPDMIRDHNWTHPNIELRLAFMNYYLNPTNEKRTQIENYIYAREIEPLNKQLIDPRIYQGNEKILDDKLR